MLLVAVVAVLVLAVAPVAAHAQAATINVSTGGSDTCTRTAGPCATLARAVAVAQSGDTIQFGPGQFAANTTAPITKTLTFRGALAGVPVTQRDPAQLGAETVLVPGGATLLNVGGPNTVVDGIVFSGAASYGLYTCGLTRGTACATGTGSVTVPGIRVVNNMLLANKAGMYMRFGRDIQLTGNLFAGNGRVPTGTRAAIYADDSANDVTITGNQFTDNNLTLSLTLAPAAAGSNVSFTDNAVIGDTQGPGIRGVQNLTISDNVIQGGSGDGLTLNGGNGTVRIDGNQITGKGADGILLRRSVAADPDNRDVTIRENTVTTNQGHGIDVAANGAAGDLTIVKNRIVDNPDGGLRVDDDTVTVDAARNWWGCNLGPNTTGCGNITGVGFAAFSPWLTLSLAATPADIDAGAPVSALARLANLSSGSALADGPFFSDAPAEFSSTPAGGTFTPQVATLSTAELTAASAFAAGPRPTELAVSVDNETVGIRNSDPPAPDVIPDVIPDDRSLTPTQRAAAVVVIRNRGNGVARRLSACLRLSAKLNGSGRRCRQIARLRPGQTIAYRVLARARLNACRGRLAYRLAVRYQGLRGARRDRAPARLRGGPCRPQPCPTVARVGRTHRHGAAATTGRGDRATRPRPVRARAAC